MRREVVLTLGHLTDEGVLSQVSQSLTADTDWQVRRNAAKSLALHASPAALPALSTALQDNHWQVRKFALQALQHSPDNASLANLMPLLKDEFADVRQEAAIAKLTTPAALNALQPALDDPDREVSIQAERAIEKVKQFL